LLGGTMLQADGRQQLSANRTSAIQRLIMTTTTFISITFTL
jgi:hypothetical protein